MHLTSITTATDPRLSLTVERDGVSIMKNCLPDDSLRKLTFALPPTSSNIRNALDLTPIAELAACPAVRRCIIPSHGESCFAVRAIVFNKSEASNWKVAWHQDRVIAVKERIEVPGWGPWSVKLGVAHVRPPSHVLERMIALRLHLDDCGIDNGPLRVLPGTHRLGILSDAESAAVPRKNEIVCAASRGDVILMRPLTVHASSSANKPGNRRVIHIEFASDQLPPPLEWYQQVS
jgi:ectoine hydroxylase-related dioxygenase (phytanoyl-CoA dioxygenase family)